ncbi:MAG: hypothetical protein RIB93_18875 [Coleofasciculus sp. D1-CHI-01]|uniref:hypothetical protein n=1 Tax=Coleofasciculus sp. D1-CHI-01 TaxID=3068482 RepID=UPI0032FE1DF2
MPSSDITQRNLSEYQALALIEAADNERDRVLVRLLYNIRWVAACQSGDRVQPKT